MKWFLILFQSLTVFFLFLSISNSHLWCSFMFSIFIWLILKYLVTVFIHFCERFCSILLLSKRTLFSYFLQCCMGFPLHCTFLHKFSLLKLLGRIGQDSYSIFMTWEILFGCFCKKIKILSEICFPFCPYSFYLDLFFILLSFLTACLIYILVSVVYLFFMCLCLGKEFRFLSVFCF